MQPFNTPSVTAVSGLAAQGDVGQVKGRVEHLVSRHSTRFQSLKALLAFISRLLREVRDADSRAES